MPGYLDYGLGSVAYGLDPTASSSIRPPSDVGPGQWIQQPRGTGRLYRAALIDPTTGEPVAPGSFGVGAIPSAEVWDGSVGPILASPACAWDNSDQIAIDFTVAASDIASLDAQPYPIRLFVGDGGVDPVAVWDGWLEVLEAQGSADLVPIYSVYRDMVRHCGSRLAQFLTIDDRAGFLTERGQAREWFDGLVLAHYRPKLASYYGVGMAYTYGTGSLFPLGIGTLGYPTAQQAPDQTMLDALAADGLQVTPRIVEACSRYAASLILGRQSDAKWQQWGLSERIRAEALAGSTVALVSTTGDGNTNLVVNLSIFDSRDV
jgi:hypothetical protein